ncbi:MAG: hypothetical protein K2Q26_08320 [Bdellovibrionales bacterium]|nr:hypothetical protein [Bdellovibrionales bacterium]
MFGSLFILIVFLALPSFAQNADENKNFEAFKVLLQEKQAKSIEEFLPAWKKSSPEFFKKYLLGYRSRSLQNSSFRSPRVLMFSRLPLNLVIAFNGSPEHRGFKDLEVMAFNPKTDAFEFYEVTESVLKSGQLPAPNPKKCLECHQSPQRSQFGKNKIDPRPNWEPYNKWPGFYESMDTYLSDYDHTHFRGKVEELRENPEDARLADEIPLEPLRHKEFYRDILPTHPRYVFLDPIEHDRYNDRIRNGGSLNVEFTKHLSISNFFRVSRLMTEETEVFDFVKWALAVRYKCQEDVVPQEVRTHITGEEKSQWTYQRTTYTQAVDILFTYFGVDTEDWSMDFKTHGRFSFNGGRDRFASPGESWEESRPAAEKYILSRPEIKDLNCMQLKEKASTTTGNLAAVQAFKTLRSAQTAPRAPEPPLIQRCIACHASKTSDDGDIPLIPFGNPEELAKALKTKGYKRGTLLDEIRWRLSDHATIDEQMPPSKPSRPAQRQELLRYLEKVPGS